MSQPESISSDSIMQRFFIICERDAGLFSLIQQVIANLPRALNAASIPIVYFGENCCYWVPDGYRDKKNVWEYYFEPLLENYTSDRIPNEVKLLAKGTFNDGSEMGVSYSQAYYLTNNFGDHSMLRHKCLSIPYEWQDPDKWTRRVSSRLINDFVRPKQYLVDKANTFAKMNFGKGAIIGVHIRGTDALSTAEPRLFRKNSLVIERYITQVQIEKKRLPQAKIFVATDSVSSLEAVKVVFGSDVMNSSTILHSDGEVAGKGPTGALMPGYIASDATIAVENGAEAIVDYLLLKKCHLLIHNGASLARTVLLSEPDMPHFNTHSKTLSARFKSVSLTPRSVLKKLQKWDERIKRSSKINFETWANFINNTKYLSPMSNTKRPIK